MKKSTAAQIRARFDNDVERFSNLETGQSATVDAPLAMELIASAAAATNPRARRLLDIGCGAGNYSLKILAKIPDLDVTLVDLSQPMLDRAMTRVAAATTGKVVAKQADIRELALGKSRYDVIVAAAVFHHLRSDAEWRSVFKKCHDALKAGGSLWIFDLVSHDARGVDAMMKSRYGAYLEKLKDAAYRDHVFAYIEEEDTPRSLPFQVELLLKTGFRQIEILHKNSCFAAFGAIKKK